MPLKPVSVEPSGRYLHPRELIRINRFIPSERYEACGARRLQGDLMYSR